MGRAQPGTGQHCDGQLGDHRQVDRNPIAGLHAQFAQGVRRPTDLGLQVAIGDRPGIARLADPVIGNLLPEAPLHVPIDAVVGDVEATAGEPLGERQVPFQGLLEGREPGDPLPGALRPERLEVRLRLGVQVCAGVRLGAELGRGREAPILGQQVLDLRMRRRFDAHCAPPPAGQREAILRGRPRVRQPSGSGSRPAIGQASASDVPAPAPPPPSRPAICSRTGMTMPCSSKARSSRRRSSPEAAQRSAGRTWPRILSVTP